MSLFQILAIPCCLIAAAASILQSRMAFRLRLFWLIAWVSAGIAIAYPNSVVLFARRLGIGRGADLVLYAGVLFQLYVTGYFYRRYQGVQQSLTAIVRKRALATASRGLLARNGQDSMSE